MLGAVTDARLVLVTSRSFGRGSVDPTADLAASRLQFVRSDPRHDIDALSQLLPAASGWIAGTGPIGEEHFTLAPRLRIVARYGVGVDNVDLEAASLHGVIVTNTPGANAGAVADHTIGLMLAALRNTVAGDRAVRTGDWSSRPGRDLAECTVGIVGYGTIGRAVHRRLVAFGCTVVGCDPAVDRADIPMMTLEDLLRSCDVVTLHAPGSRRPLIDAEHIALMRPNAVLINTARAGLVDEVALATGLKAGALGAAALDVLGSEHRSESPMLAAPRTILTPHLAGQTRGAMDRLTVATVEECRRVLVEGLLPRHAVTS